MTPTFPIDPARTAVLGMDCQTGIISIYAKDDKDAFLARAAAVITDCCADLDTQLHDCLINKLFPSRAAVLSALEFIEASCTSPVRIPMHLKRRRDLLRTATATFFPAPPRIPHSPARFRM